MAMTGTVTGIGNMTVSNGAIESLRDLLIQTAYKDPDLEAIITPVFNARNGDKLGWLGDLAPIGNAGAGCSPTYANATQYFAEKTWAIGQYSSPLKWCYQDYMATIAEYALKHGKEIGDITATEIMDIVIAPALEKAIKEMYWRIAWFGDTAAANVSNSGVITNGVSTTLFTAADGLWKRLFAVGTGNAAQVETITANSAATAAAQKSGILTQGVATGIIDNVLLNADSRIAQNGGVLLMTDSMAKALTHDIKKSYNYQTTWEDVMDGVKMTTYDGVPVYSIAIWDRMIKAYQNNGTTLNLPHRVVYASPKQLLVGTPSDKLLQDFDIFFDRTDRTTKAYLAGSIGTLIGEDDLVHLAY